MPAMDEGCFALDYFAPAGTPLKTHGGDGHGPRAAARGEPGLEMYVRRTGTELGLFATKTNRGDIQVSLRPAEDDPLEPADQAGPAEVQRRSRPR